MIGTTRLEGTTRGRYPYGNSLLIRGRSETWLVDPSLDVAANPPSGVDRLIISHCHEDHLAGVFQYPSTPVLVPEPDRPGIDSLDGLMALYGMPPEIDAKWRRELVDTFHYVPRPDAESFSDGAVFDLGGVTVTAIHLPGHTQGHSGFLIEPDGIMFLADIDLTGFGPYYGDRSSSLVDFERSIARCRDIEAATYMTFHHKGIVQGRTAFLEELEAYQAVIGRRERQMLDFLTEPRTIDDMVAHRFVYRPHVNLLFTQAVEHRSAVLHVTRLLASGAVHEVEAGRFMRTGTT